MVTLLYNVDEFQYIRQNNYTQIISISVGVQIVEGLWRISPVGSTTAHGNLRIHIRG